MAAYPQVPPLHGSDGPEIGQTRVQHGRLQYLYQGNWVPAVRQYTIRATLLHQVDMQGSYTHGRSEDGNGTNRTAFLFRDRDYGEDWARLPPVIYELYQPADRRAVKPVGPLMYGDCVMLDPYDHPIRDFPGDLPVVLCADLHGVWVEYYLRSNREIRPYDLMARMPFVERTHKPVRVGTLIERATKFRKKAACSTWNDKTGSVEIRQAILDMLPLGATNTRSLGEYLTKEQLNTLYKVNKGTAANRARKANRAAQGCQASLGHQPGQSSQQPASKACKSRAAPFNCQSADRASTRQAQHDNIRDQSGSMPSNKRKRNRGQTSLDLVISDTSPPSSKRVKGGEVLNAVAETDGISAKPATQKRGADTAFSDDDIPDIGVQRTKRPKTSNITDSVDGAGSTSQHNSSQLKKPAAESSATRKYQWKAFTNIPPLQAPSNSSRKINGPIDSPDTVVFPETFGLSDNVNENNISDWNPCRGDPFLPSSPQTPIASANPDRKRAAHAVAGHSRTTISKRGRGKNTNKRSNAHGTGHSQPRPHLEQLQASRVALQSDVGQNGPIEGGAYNNHQIQDTQTPYGHQAFPTADAIPDPQQNENDTFFNDLPANSQATPATNHALPPPPFHPNNHDFYAETIAGLDIGDYRYSIPGLFGKDPEVSAIIQRALMLSYMDYIMQTGNDYPWDLALAFEDESYMSQWRRLQEKLEKKWQGPGPAPQLYCLPAWFRGWDMWAPMDARGRDLQKWVALQRW